MNRVRPIALLFLTLIAPTVVAAWVLSPRAGEIAAVAVVMAAPVAMIVVALGARVRAVALPLAMVLVAMEVSGFALLALRGGGPVALLVLLGGLWLAPLVILAAAYARAFPGAGVTDADLRRMESANAHRSDE
jgi:hypothetical protein